MRCFVDGPHQVFEQDHLFRIQGRSATWPKKTEKASPMSDRCLLRRADKQFGMFAAFFHTSCYVWGGVGWGEV